jgi:hypothetical protein
MPAQIHVNGAMFPVKKLLAELLADITKAKLKSFSERTLPLTTPFVPLHASDDFQLQDLLLRDEIRDAMCVHQILHRQIVLQYVAQQMAMDLG